MTEQPGTKQTAAQSPNGYGAARFDQVRMQYELFERKEVIVALDDVSFDIRSGEFISIIGPSGCGKTTLLKLLAGLFRPSAGKVLVNGHHVTDPVPDVGMVFQNPALMKWRTAVDNVAFPLEIKGRRRKDARTVAYNMLKMVGLDGFEHRYPFELSGGMQQRVGLARGLVHDPPILLMDEPFSALDALTREKMTLEFLRILERNAKTIVLVTHKISEAVFLADRVVTLSARPGRVVADMKVDLGRPRDPKIRYERLFSEYCQQVESLIVGDHADNGVYAKD